MTWEHVIYFLAGFFLLPVGMRPYSIRESLKPTAWLFWLVVGVAAFYVWPEGLGDPPVHYTVYGAGTLATLVGLSLLLHRIGLVK